jgi:hypothetical protein
MRAFVMGAANWLERRLELLERAIAEMEAHLERPWLDPGLNPDVPGCLVWARSEVERIAPLVEDSRIAA